MKQARVFLAVLTAIVLLLFATAARADIEYSYTITSENASGTVETGYNFVRAYVLRHPPSQPYYGTVGFGSYSEPMLHITRTGGGNAKSKVRVMFEIQWERDHKLRFLGGIGGGQIGDSMAYRENIGGDAYGTGWKGGDFSYANSGKYCEGYSIIFDMNADNTIHVPAGSLQVICTMQLNNGLITSQVGASMKFVVLGLYNYTQ